jgi:GNAT superfamily N-acetyltransferase
MEETYQITYEEKLDDSVWEAIGGGINTYNTQHAGDDHAKRLCYVLRGANQQVIGGIIGVTYWNWLYIELLFIPEALRSKGYGRQLMQQAEEEARQRGAQHAYLDTFSFQAPEFYAKLGYRVFGELADFPLGQTRYFMTKEL